jgi:hypothetical protein
MHDPETEMPTVFIFLGISFISIILKVCKTQPHLPFIMMIRTLQNAALFLVLVSCTQSASAAEHNDLNKVLSSIILEMNNEGVFTEYWYVLFCVVCCRKDLVTMRLLLRLRCCSCRIFKYAFNHYLLNFTSLCMFLLFFFPIRHLSLHPHH